MYNKMKIGANLNGTAAQKKYAVDLISQVHTRFEIAYNAENREITRNAIQVVINNEIEILKCKIVNGRIDAGAVIECFRDLNSWIIPTAVNKIIAEKYGVNSTEFRENCIQFPKR